MIESLTAEQQAKFPEYVDRWTNIGLSTEPVDFENAKKAICSAYKRAKLKEPTKFHVVGGPIEAIEYIQKVDSSKTKQSIFDEMIYGNHDASWLAIYQYFRDEVDIKVCHELDDLIELSKYCGWLNVYEDLVVFQDRPEIIKFDNNKQLHCENGPAIKYRDGFVIYLWHGIRIPGEWIENKSSLTQEIALTWSNIEQRRCACEILGWNKVINGKNSKIIDEDGDPEIGTLVEVNLEGIGKERFLKVLCGTKREFVIPVPPEMQTAIEANAWTYGFTEKDFRIPEVRT